LDGVWRPITTAPRRLIQRALPASQTASRGVSINVTTNDGIQAFPCFFFFKQKTAYEIGLGIPAEPLFRSPKTSAFTLAFSTSQRLRTTRASARTFFTFRHYITPSARNF